MRYALTIVSSLFAISSLVGCAADSADDEDAIADAAPSGKSDAYGFSVGPYTTHEIDYEDLEPLIAVFHENGEVDFTSFEGGYDVAYAEGTYKLYTYRGRNRIRLTDTNGTVLLRSDWSKDADGNLEFGGESWYQQNRLPEDLVDCLAMDVTNTDLFEEGFTPYEYPDVSVSKDGTAYELQLGSAVFNGTDKIVVSTSGAETVATATTSEGYVYGLRVSNSAPRRGEVFYRESAQADAESIANIVCR